jgi:outer membrane receptor protein involved in Fe transport
MYKQLSLLFFCIFFASMAAYAGKITGVIIDEATNEPLTGVVVAIKSLGKGTQTDFEGKYEFENIESGTYEVVFSMLGYKNVLQTVSIINNKDIAVDGKLKPETARTTLSDVTVKASRVTNTENAVMMEIRKSNVVASGISAAQIGKTLDRNAADVVKRVPGVSIVEDRFIAVRGLTDRYNTVWLNDATAPSSEVDKKSFSFDVIPSGLIDRMIVYKTPSPELPGDFAGGMVKVYTTSIPDKNQITIGIQGSSRQRSTGSLFYYDQPSKTDKFGYDDGKRSLPELTPAYVDKNDSTNGNLSKAFGNDWLRKTKKLGPDGRFNIAASGVMKLGKVRIGNTFGASYSNISTNYTIRKTVYDKDVFNSNASVEDQRSDNSVNVGLLNNLGVAFGNSKIEWKNLYNQLGRSTVINRVSLEDTSQVEGYHDEKSYLLGYESRAIYSSQLSGSHKTKNDRTTYNWTFGYTDLFKNQPDQRRIRYNIVAADTTYKAPIANTVDPVNGGGRFYAQLFEHTYSFNHHFTQKIKIKNYDFQVQAGNFLEQRKRNYSQRMLGYTIKSGALTQILTRLPVDEIFADSNVGPKDRFRIDEITSKSDAYTADNKMIASYVSLLLPIGPKVKVVGGVRYEYNTLFIKGFESIDSVEDKQVTKFFLPSINALYDITDKSLVRVAYGKTLNRPEFRERAPLFYYDFENRTGTYGALFDGISKNDLKVAEIQNVDVRYEWYPSLGEVLQVGAFYKKFTNPITAIVRKDALETREVSFINAQEAYTAGVEVEVRKSLAFADKWFHTKSIFSDFSFVGNATITKSEMTNKDTFTKNQILKTPLTGQSPYMFNASLFYQGAKNGLQGSLLYNVFGPRQIYLGTVENGSIGEMPFNSLDITVSKTFFKRYSINAGVQNLLDSRVYLVQDTDHNSKFEKNKDPEIQTYKPGRYYTIGIRIKL